jgi:hypothetical protein
MRSPSSVVLLLVGFIALGLSGAGAAAAAPSGPVRYFMVPLPDDGVLALPPGGVVLQSYPAFAYVSSREKPPVPGTVEMDLTVKIWGVRQFFDPLASTPSIPSGYEDPWAAKAPEDTVYGIVQFDRPMLASMEARALSLGVQLVQPLSGFAYIARGAKGAFDVLSGQSDVRWVGEYHHFYKFRGKAWEMLQTESPETEARFWMFVFHPDAAQVPAIVDSIEASGGRIHFVWHSPGSMYHTIQFWTQMKNVPSLVKWPGVYTLEDFPEYTIFNAQASWALQTDQSNVRAIHDKGVTGKGVILAVADTGVDKDHANFKSVPNKIVRYWACADADDTHGHGSHVSGTVLGDGGTAGSYDASTFDGMSFDAQLSMQDIAVGGSISCATPSANGAEAVKDGALVEQNSWGGSCGGSYASSAQDADDFGYKTPQFLGSYSNGNSGPGAGTVCAPAVAKNVLSVGATNKGGAKTMASFSSRGPSDDGRIKPTINAPGVNTDSVQNNGQYTQMSGTSMSGPAAAGMNGLTAQYFREGWYPAGVKGTGQAFTPSAAMMKAMLVASGLDQKAAGGDATNFIPDQNAQGYGKIRLDDVLFFDGETQKLFVIDGYNSSFNVPGLKTGEKKVFSVKVKAAGPFKVALVWNDPPGGNLVNNLDLMVTSPSGKKYAGNDFDGQGQSKEGGAAPDTKNVEEIMHLKTPEEGGWTIEISAVNVAQGGDQKFAVVAVGNDLVGGGAILFEKPAPGEIIMGNKSYTVTYRAVGDVTDGSVKIDYTTDNGATWVPVAQGLPKQGTAPWSVPKIDAPKVKLKATGTDSKGGTVEAESGEFGIDSSPPETTIDALPAYTKTKDVQLMLKGGDAVSGLEKVELHYKRDGGSMVKAQDVTQALPTPVTFSSPNDGTYEFFSIGVDKSGNRETPGSPNDARTVVDTKPPTVKRVNPPDKAPAVSTLSSVSVEFGEVMDEAATETAFKITPSVTGAFSWNGGTLNFDPSSALAVGTVYTVSVATTAADKAGWTLAAEYKWSFTTTPNQPDPGNVDGHVYDAIPETPVAGAKVALLFPGTPFEMASTLTDTDGKWAIENIDSGDYAISASKVSYKGATKQVRTPGGGNWLHDVDFYLFNTSSKDGALEVVVKSTEGAALSGAVVQVNSEEKGTTNEKGVLQVKPLPAGGYSIKVDREGYKSNSTTAAVKPQAAEQVVIKLAPVPFDFSMVLGWMPWILIIVIVAIAGAAAAKMAGRRECMYCHKKYKKRLPACPSCGFSEGGGPPALEQPGPPPMGPMGAPPSVQPPYQGPPPGYGGPPPGYGGPPPSYGGSQQPYGGPPVQPP